MLDIFTATMAALGMYHYEHHIKQYRTRLLLPGFGLILIVASLSANELLLLALAPFIYIFAATGVITLINQWNDIFPKNPVARAVAILPIALVLMTTMYYHGTRYFIAWSRAPETKIVYNSDAVILQNFTDKHYSSENSQTLIVTTNEEINKLSYTLLENDFETLTYSESVPSNLVNYDDVYIYRDTYVGPKKQEVLGKATNIIVSERVSDSIAYTKYTPNKSTTE